MLFETKKETEVKGNKKKKKSNKKKTVAYRSCSTRWQTQCFYEERRQTNTDKDKTTRHDDRQEIRPIRHDRN